MDTGVSQNDLEVRRTSRIKKVKQFDDLGYSEKKIKRTKTSKVDNKKQKNCQRIFEILKHHPNFHKFPAFGQIEKSLKKEEYNNVSEMALEIRKLFNEYFTKNIIDPVLYTETLAISTYFEQAYKDQEEKYFWKESKYVLDLKKKLNKLKRDIGRRSTTEPDNKLKISLNSSTREKRLSKKYKLNLVNSIRDLSSEQARGILNIVHDCIHMDKESAPKSMELDINKLPSSKLREIEKYVKKCIMTRNRSNINSSSSVNKINNPSTPYNSSNVLSYHGQNSAGDGINVNININNNFVMNNYRKSSDDTQIEKKLSILSDSDSLSSDDDSGKITRFILDSSLTMET